MAIREQISEGAPSTWASSPGRHALTAASSRALTHIRAARLLCDAAALGLALFLAFSLRFRWHILELTRDAPFDAVTHAAVGSLWLAGVLVAMAAERLYDEDTLGSGNETSRVARAVLVGIAVVSVAAFLLHLVTVSRGWFGLVVAISFVSLTLERKTFARGLRRFRSAGRLRRPAILVGDDTTSMQPSIGEFDVMLRVHPRALPSVIRELGEARARRSVAPAIIVDGASIPDDDLWRLVIRAGEVRAPLYLRSAMRSVGTDRLTTRELEGRTIVKVAPPALTGLRAFEKRALDLIVSGSLMTLLAIPMLVIATLVFVTSGRPILYGQQRVGRGGRVFTMWKFRSMQVDAEAASGPVWASGEDPRCTSVGRWLRRLSLDELPQLWNVLRGDMSIVGPRPERPVFVAEFSEGFTWYRYRHRTRPGVTGLAQIQGLRGDTPLAPRVDSDNRYIEHWSLGLDIRIMLRTAIEVLRGRNAG